MISLLEQENTDIDWFFINSKFACFVASGGGKLPNSVSESSTDNIKLVNYFRNLEESSDIDINPELNKNFINDEMKERYLSDFVFMSKKGLYSFDKTKLNDFNDTNYHLVTIPKNPLTIEKLPKEIIQILNKTKIEDEIKSSLDINKIL